MTRCAPARRALALACLTAVTGCDATQQPPGDQSAAEVVRVQYVTDGDTIRLTDGRDVRLIGIDTPERGSCGYDEARNLLAQLLREEPVTITEAPGQDADRYDRLLRYVEAGERDVAEVLIDRGWARARYDSLDGYPEHPRQDDYRAADATSDNRGC